MGRAIGVLVLVSAALFAGLTAWTNHTTAATAARSHAFAQSAKSICDHAPHTANGVETAARRLAALPEPPNARRAVARLELHWRRIVSLLRAGVKTSSSGYRAELKQARLSAHLLNVTACRSIAPQ
jgi:hypothetical protein